MSSGPDVFLKYYTVGSNWYGRIEHPIYHDEEIEAESNVDLMDKAKKICREELGHNMFVLIMNRMRDPNSAWDEIEGLE